MKNVKKALYFWRFLAFLGPTLSPSYNLPVEKTFNTINYIVLYQKGFMFTITLSIALIFFNTTGYTVSYITYT